MEDFPTPPFFSLPTSSPPLSNWNCIGFLSVHPCYPRNDYRYDILTFDLEGDARALRLLVVRLEHGVVGLARDPLAVLEARGHEGDAALRLVRLVILKRCDGSCEKLPKRLGFGSHAVYNSSSKGNISFDSRASTALSVTFFTVTARGGL